MTPTASLTSTAADPAQLWMDAFRALWADATPEVMRAAREYVQLMASPEEAVRDLGGPLAAVPTGHSAEPEWHSGGPGKSAYEDYRWQCACGHRYDEPLSDGIRPRHYVHLADPDAD